MSTPHRIPGERIALAVTQARYLADVAERAVSLGEPLSDDSLAYAFAITPVPEGIDATTDPMATAEAEAVRTIVRAALEVSR